MFENQSFLSYYKRLVDQLVNKKSLKQIQSILDSHTQANRTQEQYTLIQALLENIEWTSILGKTVLRDSPEVAKLNYLSKKLKVLSTEHNFIDYFSIIFIRCHNFLDILSNLENFYTLLKLNTNTAIIISTSLAYQCLDLNVKKMGFEELFSQLKCYLKAKKSQDFPGQFVSFFVQFMKEQPKPFKRYLDLLKNIFQEKLLIIKDQKIISLLGQGDDPIFLAPLKQSKQQYEDFYQQSKSQIPFSKILQELKPPCSESKSQLFNLFKGYPHLEAEDVFDSLMMMQKSNYNLFLRNKITGQSDRQLAMFTMQFLNNPVFDYTQAMEVFKEDSDTHDWKIDHFIKFLKQFYQKKIIWTDVYKIFIFKSEYLFNDFEEIDFFKQLLKTFNSIREYIGISIPSELFYIQWKNKKNQSIFMSMILEVDDIYTTLIRSSLDKRRNINLPQVTGSFEQKIKELNQFWSNKDFIQMLLQVSEQEEQKKKVKQLIQKQIKINFEGTFFLLVAINFPQGNPIQDELLQQMILQILNSSSTLADLIEVLFQVDKHYLTFLLVQVCDTEHNFIFLSKILDYSQTIKDFFIPLTQTDYHNFSISLSLLAVKREFLRLENWLEGRLSNGSLLWLEEFIRYIDKKILLPLEESQNPSSKYIEDILEKSQITMNGLAIIFENFFLNEKYVKKIPISIVEKVKEFYESIQFYLPELSQVCTNDTEKKANSILKELYFNQMEISDFVEKVLNLKKSNSNRDQEVLSCIIINLIDEFRFYHQFPKTQLFITSDIFGQFISKKVIDGKVFLVFLKALSDSLNSEDIKMYQFGLRAVKHFIFQEDLNINVDFYKLLFSNKRLKEDQYELLHDLLKILKKQNKLNNIPIAHQQEINQIYQQNAEHNNSDQKEQRNPKPFKRRLNPASSHYTEQTLMQLFSSQYNSLNRQLTINPQDTERIIFWINSVEQRKINVPDFQKLLKNEQLVIWFANYLVYTRIPHEPSNQNIFRKLVIRSSTKQLYDHVYSRSMRMINQTIDFIIEKERIQTEERNISKNCGKWIGFITFMCNRPILVKDFDIKNKIFQAYEQNKIQAIIPVICTVLFSIDKSSLFNIKVPFVNAICDVLREIKDIKWLPRQPTKFYIEVLFNELKLQERDLHRFNFIKNKTQASQLKQNIFIVKSLPDLIKFPNESRAFEIMQNHQQINFKQLFAMAIDLSIKDLIHPVRERSLSNTIITTKELILKDFMGEPDPKKVRAGAEAMITNLTWNLALITCRDPLLVQIILHLNQLLNSQTNLSQEECQMITETIGEHNLNLACEIIKGIVIQDSLSQIAKDPIIQNDLKLRKAFSEKGRSFQTEKFMQLKKEMPAELNISEAYKNLSKIDIYNKLKQKNENFVGSENSNVKMWTQPQIAQINHIDKVRGEIAELLETYEKQVTQANTNKKMQVIRRIYSNLSKILHQTKNIKEQIFPLSEFVLKKLFIQSGKSSDLLKYYSDVLIIYSNLNPKLAKLITNWIFSIGDKLFKNKQIVIFLRRNLLHLDSFDKKYAQALKGQNRLKALLCIVLVLKGLVIEDKIFSIYNFSNIVREIIVMDDKEIQTCTLEVRIFVKNLKEYIENHNQQNTLVFKLTNLEPEYEKLFKDVDQYFCSLKEDIYERVKVFLKEFLQAQNFKEMESLIKEFDENIIRKNDEKTLIIFFCYLFEISVNKSLQTCMRKQNIQNFENLDYTYIDATSKFITILIKSSVQSAWLFEKILTSLIIVLTKKHFKDKNIPFNQKPFFKILFNIIYDLNRIEYNFQPQINKFSNIIVQTLHILQPIKYPSFAFAWLQLVSSKFFIKTLLETKNHEKWNNYTILLVDLMTFYKDVFTLELFQRSEVKLFYKGTLRLLIILIHDFKDFLCERSFTILEEIPTQFKQFRNIILSAYPKDLQIQNPYSQNQINCDSEELTLPHLSSKIEARINSHDLHNPLIDFIKKSDSQNEIQYQNNLKYIINSLFIKTYQELQQINTLLLESLVTYVPYFYHANIMQKVKGQKNREYRKRTMSLFQIILKEKKYELRNQVINAMLNNLRYPNKVTFFFIQVFLNILKNGKDSMLNEQILTNLLDRLIVEKPHPWGILVLIFKILAFIRQKPVFEQNKDLIEKLMKLAFQYAKINNK